MTNEDKQLVFKDLCARLPYRVICHSNKINLDGELLFINKVYNIVALYNENAIGKFDTCLIADIKPYLRPLSSMTKEEKNGYETFFNYDGVEYPEEYIDWHLEHHFDYRGLIEKGFALEAPEGMYKTE